MTLDEIGNSFGTDKGSISTHNYLDYYDYLFGLLREEPIVLVEIGVQFGYSIKMWLEYFTQAKIHGIDIVADYSCSNPRVRLWTGDQRDVNFWNRFKSEVPYADIIIDDGCHNADAQKITFESLWPLLKSGGTYIIEDWFTVYDPHFASPVSGSDWLASLVASLNWNGKSYHGKPGPVGVVTDFEKSIHSIVLRKGLVVIKKQ